MDDVKRYRATIGNGSTSRREWVYLCRDIKSPKHEQLFKNVSAQSVYQLSELQQELDAQRLRADTAEAELAEMTDNFNIVVRQKIELAKQNGEFSKLMQEFCRRVEAGEVRSKTTYTKFKAALNPKPDCCQVSAEDQALLNDGEYTPEELFGAGGKPSCPKCFNPKPEAIKSVCDICKGTGGVPAIPCPRGCKPEAGSHE